MGEINGVPHLDLMLLPIYQEYKRPYAPSNTDFGIWAYLNQRGDTDLAAAFSKLFWPDFVEVDGYVLLAERYSAKSFVHWQNSLNGNRPAIESTINHVHIWDLFLQEPAVVRNVASLHDYLARILIVCWKQALQEAFPEKRFTFSYLTTEEGYGPEISFCQSPE